MKKILLILVVIIGFGISLNSNPNISSSCLDYEIISEVKFYKKKFPPQIKSVSYKIKFTSICEGIYYGEYEFWNGKLWCKRKVMVLGGRTGIGEAGPEGKVRNVKQVWYH